MKIKTIRNAKNLEGKRVFLRSDFNVPIKKGKIIDNYKIAAGLETIRFLMRHKAKIIISTHLGDPKKDKSGKIINKKDFSTLPIAKELSRLLHVNVEHYNDCVGKDLVEVTKNMREGSIIILENLRFYSEEEKNDRRFAELLSRLADIYVNNAFCRIAPESCLGFGD